MRLAWYVYCWTKHFSPPAATNQGSNTNEDSPLPLDHLVTTVRGQIRNVTKFMIGASPILVGLHCRSVFVTYVLACLPPYTVNFKCTFKYFPTIEHSCAPIASINRWRAMLSYCQSAALGNCSQDSSSLSTHSTFFFMLQQLWTNH